MSKNTPSVYLERIARYLATGSSALPVDRTRYPVTKSLRYIVEDLAADSTKPGLVQFASDTDALELSSEDTVLSPLSALGILLQLRLVSFTGHNGAGACTATGLNIGDIVLAIGGLTDMGDKSLDFENVITVSDQIQQVSISNLSEKNFMALVYQFPSS